MIIGHYQCVCRDGDFEANLNTIVRGLELAAEARVKILSFPECMLSGYFRTEKEARANCFAVDSPQFKKVLRETSRYEITCLVGFYELRGGKLYNTVAVVDNGAILGCYSKAFPCCDFETPGREFPVFEKNGLKFGIVICADGGYIEPCRILALKGAKFVFAPHYNHTVDPVQHYQKVRNDHVARAVENGIYFLRANCVMSKEDNWRIVNGEPRFGYGDSYLLSPAGEIVAAAGLHDTYLMSYNLDLDRYGPRDGRSLTSGSDLLEIYSAALDNAAGNMGTR